ncbi:TraR/DksA family transcriptional regulator [Litoreibacter halocynthiae]|uniref:TraR/DksA family transcriptional regulator n=1 Tax=Litoreibacter halocynthiae TaxID=1242689 RepID=A0A4R7LH47_9RHOB|nr:TraR/DksA C4-type zinc finger protein [Litoreibacter halocynthiae]TDT75073.1 TraR/DksA family transcriptional regulator [Litoreibacter halocynthiae]
MTTTAQYKSKLLARRAELVERSEEVESELDAHNSKDWEELAVERETDEVLEGLGNNAAAEIIRIDAALKRIEEGQFGFCVKCDDQISAERLELLPYTPFCRNCAT